MSGTLSIVATPIGNLGDITLRALETLRTCDLIVCEDTRVTSKLLAAHEIQKSLASIHAHSVSSDIAKIIEKIRQGTNVAYVSDAGTPNVNDPGGILVEAAFDAGVTVIAIPGPSAVTAAISVCGFPMEHFTYVGFAPHKKGRQTFFKEIAECQTPTIFLESTHRIEKTLDALAESLDEHRKIFVGRELTKMHETLYRGNAKEVQTRICATSTKGEFVIIVAPQPKR